MHYHINVKHIQIGVSESQLHNQYGRTLQHIFQVYFVHVNTAAKHLQTTLVIRFHLLVRYIG